jgi:hypothetical protein
MRSLPSRAQIQEHLNVIFPRSAFDPIHSCAQIRGQVGVSASTQHRPADRARNGHGSPFVPDCGAAAALWSVSLNHLRFDRCRSIRGT